VGEIIQLGDAFEVQRAVAVLQVLEIGLTQSDQVGRGLEGGDFELIGDVNQVAADEGVGIDVARNDCTILISRRFWIHFSRHNFLPGDQLWL